MSEERKDPFKALLAVRRDIADRITSLLGSRDDLSRAGFDALVEALAIVDSEIDQVIGRSRCAKAEAQVGH